MALPAAALPADFPPFPVLNVEALLSRLPAEVRARVAWARGPIERGLARLRLLQSFLGLTLALPADFMAQVDETLVAKLGAHEEFKPYVRALIVLMGAAETRKSGVSPERARELLDVAFVELNKFRATLRRAGVFLTPFPNETVEERRRGLLESADRLRRSLSDEDWRVLEQARMHDLR